MATFASPITKATQAAALTAVLRQHPPRLRLTRGMAVHARRLELDAQLARMGRCRCRYCRAEARRLSELRWN
jgi:hypothetical protein